MGRFEQERELHEICTLLQAYACYCLAANWTGARKPLQHKEVRHPEASCRCFWSGSYARYGRISVPGCVCLFFLLFSFFFFQVCVRARVSTQTSGTGGEGRGVGRAAVGWANCGGICASLQSRLGRKILQGSQSEEFEGLVGTRPFVVSKKARGWGLFGPSKPPSCPRNPPAPPPESPPDLGASQKLSARLLLLISRCTAVEPGLRLMAYIYIHVLLHIWEVKIVP